MCGGVGVRGCVCVWRGGGVRGGCVCERGGGVRGWVCVEGWGSEGVGVCERGGGVSIIFDEFRVTTRVLLKHNNTYLIFYVNGPEHLYEVAFGVLEELLHLHVGLQLVELLNLHQTISLLNC